MLNFSFISIKNFTTKTKSLNQLYGYALRDKFAAICHADLISKVLNKTENDIMLLRSDFINIGHVDNNYSVYNGYTKLNLLVKQNMVGFRVGEFIHARKIKNLNSKDTLVRKNYKRIQKPKAKLSKDRQKLLNKHFNVIKNLYLNS